MFPNTKMEVPISQIESYFGIRLKDAITNLNDQLRSRTLHQDTPEIYCYSNEDDYEDQD